MSPLSKWLHGGHAAEAAAWLARLAADDSKGTEAADNLAVALVELGGHEFTEPVLSDAVRRLVVDRLPAELASTVQAGSMGAVAQGTVDLLAQARRLSQRQEAWWASANVLFHALKRMEDKDLPMHMAFARSVLDVTDRQGRSLAQALAWLGTVVDEALQRRLGPLALRAAASHCADLLQALVPFMRASPQLHPALLRAVAMAGQEAQGTQRWSPVTAADFRASLHAVRNAGIDFTQTFVETVGAKPCRTSMLHLLAKSENPGHVDALIVALQEGCDPKLRDQHGRQARHLVSDPQDRRRWIAVETSFMAREEARAALRDLSP